jgi:hypothetical protein
MQNVTRSDDVYVAETNEYIAAEVSMDPLVRIEGWMC